MYSRQDHLLYHCAWNRCTWHTYKHAEMLFELLFELLAELLFDPLS